MPQEMFGDVAVRRPARTRFRRVLTVASIVLHAIVISSIVVVQLFAVGPPPLPPAQPRRVHAGMQAPVKTIHVDPIYPAIAQTARVQGVVILEAIIDERGLVKSVSVLRSIPLLDRAAEDAVRQWRFTPARLNGEAVPVVMTVTVRFTIDR